MSAAETGDSLIRDFFLSAPLLIAAAAIALGSAIDALVKGLAPEAGLFTLLAWRFFFGAGLALAVFIARRRPRPGWEAVRFHTLRGLLQLGAAICFFYALMQLGLAEATLIGFTAALIVPFIAWALLGERITRIALMATGLGFTGAAIAIALPAADTYPAAGNRSLGLIAVFAAAGLYALVMVMLRMRALREDATTIAMFTNLVPALALLPILLISLGRAILAYLPVFALLGVMGYVTWYLLTLAYARAPAQQLAPLDYTALIWSSLLGAVFFAETPAWPLYLGAALIIISCLTVAFEDRFRTRRLTRLPTSNLPD